MIPENDAVMVEKTFHQELKKLFVDGKVKYMTPILLCFILGLALAIERIIYLTLSSSNTNKLIKNVESAFKTGGENAAKEVCRNSAGVIARVFYEGIDKYIQSINHEGRLILAEKTIIAHKAIQISMLKKGISWISIFIILTPLLGFFGTIVEVINSFNTVPLDAINNSLLFKSIGPALIPASEGLIIAAILQVFYTFIISKIDSLVYEIESASTSLVDILHKYHK